MFFWGQQTFTSKKSAVFHPNVFYLKKMSEKNYFEYMGLPLAFKIDEGALRKRYYTNSRDVHPDMFSLSDEGQRAWALEETTINNEAYATLSNFDKRMAYILRLKGKLGDESKPDTLPQDFLMEMMDINEAIMDLQMDFDATRYEKTVQEVDSIDKELYQSVENILENYSENTENDEDLEKIKFFFLKKKYLLRIRKNLFTFASA